MAAGVTFESPAFSVEAPWENGKQFDLPLGDDLAALLAERLRALAPDIEVDEPCREDWGTVLDVMPPGERYRCDVSWLGYRHAEGTWGIRIRNVSSRGLLGLLAGRPRPCAHERRVVDVVASLLAADPETFRSVRWLSESEYDAQL